MGIKAATPAWEIQEFMENQAGSSKQSIPPFHLALGGFL